MNFKKAINTLLVSVVSIICIYFFHSANEENKKIDLIVNEIIQCYEENSKIDLNKIEIYNESDIDSAEEYLAVAYEKLSSEKNDEAIELLEKAVAKFQMNTKFAVKYLTLDLLVNALFEKDDNEKAIEYFLKIKEFSYKELNNEVIYIKKLLNIAINENGGREAIIDILESAMKNSERLDKDVKSNYANLLGMLYSMAGQYSQGIEILLESIGDVEDIEGGLYELKSVIEIGNTYSALGQIEEAEKIYKQVIDINLDNEDVVNYIMVYSYVNLYEMLIFQEKYEEFFDIAYEIDKYHEGVDEISYKSSLRIRDLSIAHAYMFMGQAEKGYEILQKIDLYEESTYVDYDIYTNIVIGDYYYQSAQYEKAFSVYEETYIDKQGLLNSRYEEMLLERIIKTSVILEDTESELKYRTLLSDIYKNSIKTISRDYVTYVVKKHASEQKLNEASAYKVRMTSFTIIIIFMTMYVLSKLIKSMRKNNIDELTGVYNRKRFDDVFNKKFKNKRNFYIIIYDIDDFKKINDTYGHAFGDEVIKKISNIAVDCSKNHGQVFRYGGEEFVVILDDYHEEKILEIAENIRSSVERYKWNEEILITISLGISSKLDTKEVTFERADNNLYISKKSGKNKITY